MLNAGNYHGHPTEATTGSKDGKDFIAVKLNVTYFANGSAWEQLDPAVERTVFLYLTDNAWEYSQKKLEAIGFNGDFDAPDFSPDARDKGVDLRMSIERYENKDREKWDIFYGGGPNVEKAPADKIRRLNALWRSRAGSSPPPAAPRTSAPSAPPRTAVAAPAPSNNGSATAVLSPTKTRDEAWAEVVEACKGDVGVATKAWGKAIAKVMAATGRAEDQFSGSDWAAVADDGSIPF